LQIAQRPKYHPDSWVVDSTRAIVKGKSSLRMMNQSFGTTSESFDYDIRLVGEEGEAIVSGTSVLGGCCRQHTKVSIDHEAAKTRSSQCFHTVCDEESSSEFLGKIFIRKDAQKADAQQSNKHLLLSNSARASSRPFLAIDADDVKASHGVTVGKLDERQLFYLQTRGIPREKAKKLLIEAFIQEGTAHE